MALIHSNSPAHRHLPRDAEGRVDTESPEFKAVVEGVRKRQEARERVLSRPKPPPPASLLLPKRPTIGAPKPIPVPPTPPSPPGDWEAVQGPRMWAELHAWGRRERLLPTTPENRVAWLNLFTRRIPCGRCKRHWADLLKRMPPPMAGTGEALYAWTIAAHNDVNIRLGKPVWGMVRASP